MADQSYSGHKICVLCGLDGERGRNRTYNLLIKSQLLCQLSYAPAREVLAAGATLASPKISITSPAPLSLQIGRAHV